MSIPNARALIVLVTGLLLTAATVALLPLTRASASCGSALIGMTQSFRSSKFGWSSWLHDSRLELTSSDVRSTPRALLVTAGRGASAMWHVPATRFDASGTYTFRGYAKLTYGSGEIRLNAQAFTSKWILLTETDFTPQSVGSESWALISGAFSVPEGASNLDINFTGLPGSWRLDDVSLALAGSADSSCVQTS